MNPREYNQYAKELRENGYIYFPDTPYQGRNLWRKDIERDNLEDSYISIEVYEHRDDFGDIDYFLRAFGTIERYDCDCKIKSVISYNTLNIIDIESMFGKYADKLKNL